MKRVLVLALAAAGLAACADYYPPPPPPGPPLPPPGAAMAPGQCFRTADIRAHTVGDDQALYLRVGRNEVWRVGMRGGCLAGSTSSDPLVIRNPPGRARVCAPLDFDVGISRFGSPAIPCSVDSIYQLSPAEIDALPP